MVFYMGAFLFFYRHIPEAERKHLLRDKKTDQTEKKDDDAVRDNQ